MNSYEIIAGCLSRAQNELNKITCYGADLKLELAHTHYEYVNGRFIRVSEGDRGYINREEVAQSQEEFIAYLLYSTIKSFAFGYECKHRRPFEDNRRQVNEIIIRCYSCLDGKYEYELLTNLKDNVHIYFGLLDDYVALSRHYLNVQMRSGEMKRRLEFIAEKQYAGNSGGMYDVAFSLEWVRYQIARILEAEKAFKGGSAAMREAFYRHENQYERLLELEKTDPDSPEKYRLGSWNGEIFKEAEALLDKGPEESVLQRPVINRLSGKQAYQCALYMLIVRIHTGRNIEQDVEMLLDLAGKMDIAPFRRQLEELFVTDRYGVFRRGKCAECRENARKRLGM